MTVTHRISHNVPALVTIALLLIPATLSAQKPSKKSPAKPAAVVASAPADSKLKGILEPISFPADVYLTDVYFATPDVGWVSAGSGNNGGMLIHTKDAGATWTVQLGDAESSDPAFFNLRFIDGQHGWVLQEGTAEYKLLHTSDGETWSQTGSIERNWGVPDYTFISASEGLHIDGNDNQGRIMRSSDGGRTWNEVFACKATVQIEGLTKNVDCALKTLHFPSPRVGYAMGGAHGAKRTLFVAKTEDGGQTWKLSVVPDVGGDVEVYFNQEAFFTDESTGVVSLSDNRIYRTTDGGQSWKGLVGTPGPAIRFADPLVGWSFSSSRTLSYTTDGGNRWTTRELGFPATVSAFSLPRRDRGFVVGEHGMIYRYRVIGGSEATPAKAISAPPMPAFDSPLDEQVTQLDGAVDALEESVAAEPEVPANATAAEASEAGAEMEELHGDAAQMSPFTAACCAKPLGKFDLLLTAVTGLVPQFLGQYKNTNLLVAGLQMLSDLPGDVNELNTALRAFRKAPDKVGAQAALAQVAAAIQGLRQTTAVAFQKQLPPQSEAAGEAGSASVADGQTAETETDQPQDGDQ